MSGSRSYCPGCGKGTGSSDSFCMSCGTDLSGRPPAAEAVQESAPVAGADASGDQTAAGRVADPYTPTPAPPGIDFGQWFKSSEDLKQGQVVIIAARWVLVAAGLLLAMWNPAELGELKVQIVLILGLAVANFFLHSRVLMGHPIHAPIVYLASAVDIAVISLIVIAGDGLVSGLFVFYFPALLALSVAFRTEATFVFAVATIAIYGLISSASLVTDTADDGAALIIRLIMLGAVAACGNVYWRIERDRRRAAEETRGEPSVPISLEAPSV